MPQAGKLRYRIDVQQPPDKTHRDTRGRRSADYETIRTVSARIEPLSGDEAEIARQLMADATAMITIRYPRTWKLTTKMRFSFRDRIFEIGYIKNPIEIREELQCLVKEAKP